MTKAAFYVGKGKDARGLGGVWSDGYPESEHKRGVPKAVLLSRSEARFEQEVRKFLAEREERYKHDAPLRWGRYDYVYAFFDGRVWISDGGLWFNPFIKVQPPKTPPPAPVTRLGSLTGSVKVECGGCYMSCEVNLSKPPKSMSQNWTLKDILVHFELQGYRQVKGRGWLCKDCIPS